jgi:hypothetical protein
MESDRLSPREFTKECSGPVGIFGVFEDDIETGYL